MATVCNAKTNEQLIEQLRKTDAFYHGEAVRKVMLGVDRGDFAPTNPYQDAPQGIGHNATISAPHMVGPNGTVVGIDHIDELVQLSERNIRKKNAELLESGRIKLVVGDGRKGYEPLAPYDAIHVGAAAPELPQALVDQLAVGGRMLIPVGTEKQEYLSIEKQPDGSITKKTLLHVIYVPLTDEEKQRKGRDPMAK
ncbi:hypothetical protein M3Y99_00126900 [Aphelenchoides fujianensis]|nr:hypothetical protein M3Y99_00126900 [Aphelenchoides fujianensis]